MSDETKQSETATTTQRPPGRGINRLFVILAGIVVSVGVVLLPANNSSMAAAEAAILTVIAVAFIDWSIFHPKRFAVQRLIVACLIGGGIGYYFQLTEAIAFQRAFGATQPSALGDIRIDGHYVGRLGDLTILMQFRADEKSLNKLLSYRSFKRDSDKEEWWGEEPATVWRQLFGGFVGYGGDAWRDIELPSNVRIFRWQGDPVEGTTLLWDADTGQTYVLYIFG